MAYSDKVIEVAGHGKDLVITSTSYILADEVEAEVLAVR